ncbi:hypothetical protein Tco_0913378 [Tanacetum coccineum]
MDTRSRKGIPKHEEMHSGAANGNRTKTQGGANNVPLRGQRSKPQVDSGCFVVLISSNQNFYEEEVAFLADLGVVEGALRENLSRNGSDFITKVHNPDNMDNNMINQGIQARPSFKQSNDVNHSYTEITSDSNIIPYSQYVNETQQAAIQNSNSSAQQDVLILYVIEQLKTQSVKIDRLKQTVTLLKNDFKKEESRNIDREIALEKKIKQLDNIVYKRDQSAQTKAQQLELKLYDGNVIKSTSAIVIPDSEETLMLAEESHPSLSCRPTKVEVSKELPKVNMCLKLETELLNKKDFIEKETYDKLFRSYTALEKHCISLEVDTQLNQEIFQRDNSVSNQSALNFDQYFELNELKAQSQEKDTVIRKLKERIKLLSRNINEDKVKKDIEEIEMINIELDHRVKPKKSKTNVLVSKPKIIKSISANNKEPSKSWGSIDFDVSSSSLDECKSSKLFFVKFRNDHVAKILGYGDYHIGNVTILRVYYMEGLGHNLFSVGKFCDSNLELWDFIPNPPPSTPYVSPSRTDWDILFQPLFDELLNPPPSVDLPAHEVIAPIEKDHPLDNIIDELERLVSTIHQLHEQALFCYYDAFLTSVEPKTYKDALTQSCWIEAMQEELNEFE